MLYRLRLRDGPMIDIGPFEDGIPAGQRFTAPILVHRRWWAFWQPPTRLEARQFTFHGPLGMTLRVHETLPAIHAEIPLRGVWALNVSLILVDDDRPGDEVERSDLS